MSRIASQISFLFLRLCSIFAAAHREPSCRHDASDESLAVWRGLFNLSANETRISVNSNLRKLADAVCARNAFSGADLGQSDPFPSGDAIPRPSVSYTTCINLSQSYAYVTIKYHPLRLHVASPTECSRTKCASSIL